MRAFYLMVLWIAFIVALIPWVADWQPEPARDSAVPVTMTTTTVATTTTPAATTTTLHPNQAPAVYYGAQDQLAAELQAIPGWTELSCDWIAAQPGDKLIDRVGHLCGPVAQARLDIQTYESDMLEVPEWDPWAARLDVVHLLYLLSAESAGDPLLNGVNHGCPSQPELKVLHPDPGGIHENGKPNCPWFQQRVPIGPESHMGHLVIERSRRILGYLINPYDFYEASLLSFALVYELDGGGWFHWWHVAWGTNRLTSRWGIRSVWWCPPDAYWQLVKGGRQECPVK